MNRLRRILLVEDNRNDVELTLTALGEHHLANAVDVVSDGVEALDYLYRRGAFSQRPPGMPAVVLLDLKLPRLSGLELLQTIKGDPELQMIPTVILSSSQEEQDLVKSYRLGVNAYIVKPMDFDSFMEAVRTLGSFWAILNEVPQNY